MAFYEDIAKYYDDIFTVSKDTLEFIKNKIGAPGKSVLDIACGTGAYSFELDKEGYKVTAVDIDNKMIENLNSKLDIEKNQLQFMQADMLTLNEKFEANTFDAIYCIGNSIVHLDSIDEMRKFLANTRQLLAEDGIFIFQIINYDRIISKNIDSLPTIFNESIPLKFERVYQYQEENNKILFKTVLSVENRLIENEIYLTPLMYDEAIRLLKDAGFKELKAYGDFKNHSFSKENSYSLIIEAR